MYVLFLYILKYVGVLGIARKTGGIFNQCIFDCDKLVRCCNELMVCDG